VWLWGRNLRGSVWEYTLLIFGKMVVGSPGAQISDSESFFFLNRYLNQSRNRESGKEGEGVVLLSGVGDGTECIGGIPRFYAGWQ